MNTFSEYITPAWEFGGDTGSYELTLQDRKDMQAISIRDMYTDGKLTIGEFAELMEATGVTYVMCDMTGLVELTFDEVEPKPRKARIFTPDDSAPWEVPKSITAHGEM